MIYIHDLVVTSDLLDVLYLGSYIKDTKIKTGNCRIFLPYLYFMQSFTRAANKYLNIFFEGAFPLITRSIIL